MKPWLLEVSIGPALSVDGLVDVSVKRKRIHDATELIYLQGLRNERTEWREGAKGRHGVSLAKLEAGRLTEARSALSCGPLLQFTGRAFKDESAVKMTPQICPENKHASQPRKM